MGRHAEVVIAAPDVDVLGAPGELAAGGKVLGVPQHLLEDPVGVVALLAQDLLLEERLVVERLL